MKRSLLITVACLFASVALAQTPPAGTGAPSAQEFVNKVAIMSVVECFETDGGVKYRSNRPISFYFMRLSFDAASDVFGLCCV